MQCNRIGFNATTAPVLRRTILFSTLLLTSFLWTASAFVGVIVPSRHRHSSPALHSTSPATATATTTGTFDTSSSSSSSSNNNTDRNSLNLNYKEYDKVILFDGVCNFCNTWVDLLLRIDTQRQFRFTPLQSPIGQELLMAVGKGKDDISSVVLIRTNENNNSKKLQYYDKSDCVLQVVQELGPIAKALTKGAQAVVPLPIRNSIYDTVAENRYNFMGKRDECRSGDPEYFDRFL